MALDESKMIKQPRNQEKTSLNSLRIHLERLDHRRDEAVLGW
jgi:hypothetical protein